MSTSPKRTVNVNVAVVGHIDSGKTSLCRHLSMFESTASFDRGRQSKERGITLDLGFSGFSVQSPIADFNEVQFTLVDCPGHASLIRTIMGGANITDMMVVVIDATKGIQTQTAEGLVLGSISSCKLLIVLNKIDLIPEDKRDKQLERIQVKLRNSLRSTGFGDAPMTYVSCAGDGIGISEVKDILFQFVSSDSLIFERRKHMNLKPLHVEIDHCFQIKGQGTVLTGTVLQGSVAVGQTIEIPALGLLKKVKSMQVFHKSVNLASTGDRVGICISKLDAKSKGFERGIVCTPGFVKLVQTCICKVDKISFFKQEVLAKQKYHITMGHRTVMGHLHFFSSGKELDFSSLTSGSSLSSSSNTENGKTKEGEGELATESQFQREGIKGEYMNENSLKDNCLSVLILDSPVYCNPDCIIIGSKLDTDIHKNVCRLAFHGKLIEPTVAIDQLRIYKTIERTGYVDRLLDSQTVIGKGLFKKESDQKIYIGLRVGLFPYNLLGTLTGSFGKSDKFRIRFSENLPDDFNLGGTGGVRPRIILKYKKYVFLKKKNHAELHQ